MRPGNAGLLRGFQWTPRNLGSTLKLWLRADLGLTIVGGNNVQDWADQSGNGNNVEQLGGGNQPTTGGTIGSNARAALQFNGVQQMQNTLSSIVAPGSQRTVFCVAKSNTALGGGILQIAISTTYFGADLLTSGGLDFVSNDGVNAGQNVNVTAGSLAAKTSDFYALWRCTGSGNAPTFRFNAANKAVVSGTQGTESGAVGFFVSGAAGLWTGNIADIVVCDTALSVPNQTLLEQYAQSWYGLP